MFRFFSFSFFFIAITSNLWGQKMVYDSLAVQFGSPKNPAYGVAIDSVVDYRIENQSFIGVHEGYKYLFVPVDRFVVLGKPLSQQIKELFVTSSNIPLKNTFRIEINEFKVGVRKQMFTKKFYTYSNITVLTQSNDDSFQRIGNLLYETTTSAKGKPKQGYEMVLNSWKEQFAADMIKLSVCPQTDSLCQLPNLLKGKHSFHKNLLGNIETAIWIDSWLVDGEIIFSRPESHKKFYRQAFCIRYRMDNKFQSFESSITNDQFNFRISKKIVLILKSKLFLGLNLWNEDEYKDRGFEDMLLLDYSFGQSIVFNPYYNKGITGGIGIMGSATYIYSDGFSVKPYLSIQFGIKL